jgi:hypothetical protein
LLDPKDQVLYKKQLLSKHIPTIFIGEDDHMADIDFLHKEEQFVKLG